jgi:hypothetical protein
MCNFIRTDEATDDRIYVLLMTGFECVQAQDDNSLMSRCAFQLHFPPLVVCFWSTLCDSDKGFASGDFYGPVMPVLYATTVFVTQYSVRHELVRK